jgi:hypothetical protein
MGETLVSKLTLYVAAFAIIMCITSAAQIVSGRVLEAPPSYHYKWQTINYPGAVACDALGLNNSGAVVGQYFLSGANSSGFLFENGTYTNISYPGATATVAGGINSSGNIAGIAHAATCDQRHATVCRRVFTRQHNFWVFGEP